eukprot:14533364-Alexandrium_andersonii.AAC.1
MECTGAQCADASRARRGRWRSCCRSLAQVLRWTPWSAGVCWQPNGLRSVLSRRGGRTSSLR